jgi:hypothetical protein
VQAKEGGNVELKSIVTHNLGDGLRSSGVDEAFDGVL